MKHDGITNSEAIIFNFGLGIRTHGISGVISVKFSLWQAEVVRPMNTDITKLGRGKQAGVDRWAEFRV